MCHWRHVCMTRGAYEGFYESWSAKKYILAEGSARLMTGS